MPGKAKCGVFFYLFLLDITNSNILNKVMFRIIDMYAIIIISNIFINITSYLSINWGFGGNTHICFIHFLCFLVYYIFLWNSIVLANIYSLFLYFTALIIAISKTSYFIIYFLNISYALIRAFTKLSTSSWVLYI